MPKRSAAPAKDSSSTSSNKRMSVATTQEGNPNPAFKGLSSLFRDTSLADVKVVVGIDEEFFHLHKAVLSLNSGYFQRIFQGDRFKEGIANRVVLRHLDSFSFAFVEYFLYHGEVMPPSTGSVYWAFDTYAEMIRDAIYFDIPLMKENVIEISQKMLRDDTLKSRFLPGGDLEPCFTEAIRILVEHYATEQESFELLLRTLAHRGYLRYMLADPDMQEILDSEPMLLRRLLGIQIELQGLSERGVARYLNSA